MTSARTIRQTLCIVVVLLAALPLEIRSYAQQEADTPRLRPRPGLDTIEAIPGVECVPFDPDTLSLADIDKPPTGVKADHWLINENELRRWSSREWREAHGRALPPDRPDPRLVLAIIRHFHMNASCWIGDPLYSFHFMLSNGKAPVEDSLSGLKPDEGNPQVERSPAKPTCAYHEIRNVKLWKDGRGKKAVFKIVDGREWMFAFRGEESAKTALYVIQKYGFTGQCYAGVGGNAAFDYFTAR